MVKGDPTTGLAGVATHNVSFNLQVSLPTQHTYKGIIYDKSLVKKNGCILLRIHLDFSIQSQMIR